MRQIMDIEDHMEIVYTVFCTQCAKQKDDNTELGNFSMVVGKIGNALSMENKGIMIYGFGDRPDIPM